MKILASIITYNPTIERLKKSINSIISQVDELVICDNDSNNIASILLLKNAYNNVTILRNSNNIGVAAALNRIAEYGLKNKYEWFLALDQDSVCPSNMIKIFTQYTHLDNAAILCPKSIDRRLIYKQYIHKNKDENFKSYIEVKTAITAGSFFNIDILKKLKGFDEYLFIDFVDYEYCYRVVLNSYKIYQINQIILDQEFGEVLPSRFSNYFLKVGKYFRSPLLLRFAVKKNYSPIRAYYTIRNLWYCQKKYPCIYSKKDAWILSVEKLIKIFIFANNKRKNFFAVIKGIRDGRKSITNPYQIK